MGNHYFTPLPITLVIILAIMLMLSAINVSIATSKATPQLQWSKTYGPYIGKFVVQTNDEGYIIAGQNATYGIRGYNNYEPSIIKTNSLGQLKWRTVIPSEGYAASIAQTKDLGYIIGCNPHGLLVKLDSEGRMQWNKSFGLTSCYVIESSDGGYIIAGSQRNANNGDDAVLIKTDENGNQVWNKTFNFVFSTWVTTFIQTNDGGYAFSGQTNWFAKTDANGDLLWNRTYNLPIVGESAKANSIVNTNDGGYILAGFAGNGDSAFLLKTDSQGNIQSSNHYEKSSFSSIILDSDGGYVTVGVYSENPAIVKMDSEGNILWNASINGNPSSIILANDGTYVIVGTDFASDGFPADIFLAKFAPESTVSPDETYPFPITWVVVAVIIVAVAGVGLWVYFKKQKRQSAV
mgnify:CR=1 FL=1